MGSTLIIGLSIVGGLLMYWAMSIAGLPPWACVLCGSALTIIAFTGASTMRPKREKREEEQRK